MTLAELLNTDLEVIAQGLGEGLRWWVAELAGMLPASMQRWFEARPSLSAEPAPGGGYRITRDGRAVMTAVKPGRAQPVTLRLPREAALVRDVATPGLPERDVRRMLELDIDRLTPFRPDQVFVDVLPGALGDHRAMVAVIPREVATLALQEAWASGLDPRALGLAGGRPAEQAIDFLPKIREAGLVPRRGGNRRLIWAAVGVLVLANLAAAVGRDMLEVQALRAQAEAQEPRVNHVLAIRRQVLREDHRRADILARRSGGDPLRMLDAVTTAVPSGAWVERLAFDGRTARLSGYRQAQIDVAAALRAAPLLTNVRNSGGDLLTRQAAGQPFDLTADLKTAPARAGGG